MRQRLQDMLDDAKKDYGRIKGRSVTLDTKYLQMIDTLKQVLALPELSQLERDNAELNRKLQYLIEVVSEQSTDSDLEEISLESGIEFV